MSDFETHNKYLYVGTEGAWRPAWVLICSRRYMSMEPFVTPARGVGNYTDGNWCHKFLRNAGFYLTLRKPLLIQVELISGYTDCLLDFGELEFPLDLRGMISKGPRTQSTLVAPGC